MKELGKKKLVQDRNQSGVIKFTLSSSEGIISITV